VTPSPSPTITPVDPTIVGIVIAVARRR
jgi:hypothetical protein